MDDAYTVSTGRDGANGIRELGGTLAWKRHAAQSAGVYVDLVAIQWIGGLPDDFHNPTLPDTGMFRNAESESAGCVAGRLVGLKRRYCRHLADGSWRQLAFLSKTGPLGPSGEPIGRNAGMVAYTLEVESITILLPFPFPLRIR